MATELKNKDDVYRIPEGPTTCVTVKERLLNRVWHTKLEDTSHARHVQRDMWNKVLDFLELADGLFYEASYGYKAIEIAGMIRDRSDSWVEASYGYGNELELSKSRVSSSYESNITFYEKKRLRDVRERAKQIIDLYVSNDRVGPSH